MRSTRLWIQTGIDPLDHSAGIADEDGVPALIDRVVQVAQRRRHQAGPPTAVGSVAHGTGRQNVGHDCYIGRNTAGLWAQGKGVQSLPPMSPELGAAPGSGQRSWSAPILGARLAKDQA